MVPAVLIAPLKNMNILMMKKSVYIADLFLMAPVAAIALPINICTALEQTSADIAGLFHQVPVVGIARIGDTRNN